MSRHADIAAKPDDVADETALLGSGNVFADLGFANPEEELLKARLVLAISERMERLSLSQTKAAELFRLSQPDVSKLLRGRSGGYSVQRLFQFLNVLGVDVEISMTAPSPARTGRTQVRVLESA